MPEDRTSPIHSHALIAALADDTRRRVFSAIALGRETASEISALTGDTDPELTKAISRLIRSGLIESAEGRFRLLASSIKDAARLARRDQPSAHTDPIHRFVRDGRLVNWPSARRDRLMVLGHIAKTFPDGEELDESKVNTLLLNLYPDFALLRRYLVDEGFLARRHDEHPSGRSIVLYRRVGIDSTATD